MSLLRRFSLVLVLLFTVGATHVSAQTVGVSNLDFTPLGTVYRDANQFLAASFTTDGTFAQYTLTAVSLPLSYDSGITDFTVGLYTDSASGLPDQLVGVLAGPSSPGSGLINFTNSAVTLNANTTYWVTWGFTSGSASFGSTQMNGTSSIGEWTLGSSIATSSDAGASWSRGGSGYPMQFSVQAVGASAVPEPATYGALFGVVALGLVCFKRRRGTAV